jgi:thiamine pyrophosphate-dependent acetolactate synthase large subunit-like protein
MPTVARAIAEELKACGVEHFICVTGGDQPLWIALDDVGITIVPCRSEHAAAYAADGYARASGRPAGRRGSARSPERLRARGGAQCLGTERQTR